MQRGIVRFFVLKSRALAVPDEGPALHALTSSSPHQARRRKTDRAGGKLPPPDAVPMTLTASVPVAGHPDAKAKTKTPAAIVAPASRKWRRSHVSCGMSKGRESKTGPNPLASPIPSSARAPQVERAT